LAACLFLAFAGTAYSQGTPSEYTTYIGEDSTYHVARVRVDAAGYTYVAGNRTSGSLTEIFVAKLDQTGGMVLFSAFGGNGTDTAADMAIDAGGNIYLAGGTTSTSFPLHNALQSAAGPGFVVKLDPDATEFLFSTYFPAPVSALAVDAAGNVYATGSTVSASFPVTAGMPADPAGGGLTVIGAAFMTKISADGARIVYSARLSGENKPCGCCSSCFVSARYTGGVAIAVDAAGNAYIAGNSDTTDLPVTAGAFQQNGIGAFVAKVDAAGTALSYLTYIGAANYVLSPNNIPGNTAAALAVDASGSVYLAGSTSDPNFPATTGAYQPAFAGPVTNAPYPPPPSDAFVLQLTPDGSGLAWATYLGGTGADSASGIALDASGNVWLAGATASADFPNAQGWSEGGDFLVGLKVSGAALVYAARYPTGTVAQSLAVDSAGLLHTAGSAGAVSQIAPSGKTVPRIFGIANAAYGPVGGQMARGEVISIYGPHIGPPAPESYTPTAAGFAPASLSTVRVMMGDYALPLLYVSDSQINAVAPFSWYGTSLQVMWNGVATPAFPFTAIDADPQIFQNPDGTAAAVNQDGALNSAANPAQSGSMVSIWVTGVGAVSLDLQDGQIATAASSFPCCTVLAGGYASNVTYSGSAPGAVAGIVQINFQVPPGPSYMQGDVLPVNVQVVAGGVTSNAVTLYVSY